jgi:hypothetical protein
VSSALSTTCHAQAVRHLCRAELSVKCTVQALLRARLPNGSMSGHDDVDLNKYRNKSPNVYIFVFDSVTCV